MFPSVHPPSFCSFFLLDSLYSSIFSLTHLPPFFCLHSFLFRVWPMPRQQSTWPGTAPTPWLHPPPLQNGWNSVASCLVASPSCCGSVLSSAFWPTPSRLPQRTSPLGITWVDDDRMSFPTISVCVLPEKGQMLKSTGGSENRERWVCVCSLSTSRSLRQRFAESLVLRVVAVSVIKDVSAVCPNHASRPIFSVTDTILLTSILGTPQGACDSWQGKNKAFMGQHCFMLGQSAALSRALRLNGDDTLHERTKYLAQTTGEDSGWNEHSDKSAWVTKTVSHTQNINSHTDSWLQSGQMVQDIDASGMCEDFDLLTVNY